MAKTTNTHENGNCANRVLAPVRNKMKCLYCTNYYAITKSDKGVILQGKCKVKDIMVWRSNFCADYNYNGC